MKCTNCGREMSDDARFCEMCGTPVSAKKPQAVKSKPEVDPHYDLSVFSDDSPAPSKPAQRQAPKRADKIVVDDDAAKTELLIDNDDRQAAVPKPSASRRPPRYRDESLDDDAAKTVVLPENEVQPVERNRFEENIALNRRYRKGETRSRYSESDPDAPRRGDYPPEAYQDDYRGYQQAEPNEYRDSYHDHYRDSEPRDDYRDDHRDDYRDDNRYVDRGSRRNNRYDDRYDNRRSGGSRKNKQKTALIISIIALILVIAILTGVIFFVNYNTVSAAELQEAKDNYLPPSQAVTIDTSLDDPSNDNIKFSYDDRARIVSCTYSANDKPYEQNYFYRDAERQLDIETTYKDKQIEKKTISYDQVKTANTIEDINGYYVRLDEESLSGSGSSGAENAAPTEAATEEWALTDAQSTEGLDDFLSHFIVYYNDYSGENAYNNSTEHKEFDCRRTSDTTQNILTNVCAQFNCVNWKTYDESAFNTFNQQVLLSSNPWGKDDYGMKYAATFRCDKADWICREIFNAKDEEIAEMYNSGYANQKIWKEQLPEGESYCAFTYGKGDSFEMAKVNEVKTDGQYYYVTYDLCYIANVSDANGNYIAGESQATYYAVLKLKNIDGTDYWSLYYNTSNVPAEITPFDSEGR